MTIQLSKSDWREIFPRAPQAVIDAFASEDGQRVLDRAGITATQTRLAYALANVEHECGGFSIKNLTENINYSAERLADVFWTRFPSGQPRKGDPRKVRAKYGTGPGWQLFAFDDIYGNRMGNRKGTTDGSRYIGRGGPQITGRDGYREVGKRAGLDLEAQPEIASKPENQPRILAAFWEWKGLNRFADAGDFEGCVKVWNGGTNGMADRLKQLAGNDPILDRLAAADQIEKKVSTAPSKPAAAPHGQSGQEIRDVQTLLDMFGYHEVGQIDGKWGSRTAGAIAAFKNDRHMDGEAVIDDALIAEISVAKRTGFTRPIAPARAEAKEEDVAKQVPELKPVQQTTSTSKWTTIVTFISGTLAAIANFFQDALAWVVRIKANFAEVPGWVWLFAACALAGAMWWLSNNGKEGIVKAFKTGERA